MLHRTFKQNQQGKTALETSNKSSKWNNNCIWICHHNWRERRFMIRAEEGFCFEFQMFELVVVRAKPKAICGKQQIVVGCLV
ncbi:hypothetical protein EXN66_Car013153 [Channa argus]|uniref:Uncharacterized protein n=1 Tax=Channa argus TaxID=215402 RepID=A0A6G1Q542_CHAAH|nr:hypothetical protein EXN66_Car013153 [Channa argus]